MGYIRYKELKRKDGGKTYQYKFYTNDNKDITNYIRFVGKKITVYLPGNNNICYISSRFNPQQMYSFLHSPRVFGYELPEFKRLKQQAEKCCNNTSCEEKCGKVKMEQCSLRNKTANLLSIQIDILDTISTPLSNYIQHD